MLPNVGRSARLYWGDESPQPLIAGVQEKSVSLAGEPVDVTDDDSAGWRELLTVAAENQVEISVSGITEDHVLETDWFAGTRTQAMTLIYSDGAQISGNFYMSAFSNTGAYNDKITFEATFMSTGAVTYTPPA